MLLLLTESTLFFLQLALTSRVPSSPSSSSVVNWATHVADFRQQPGTTEQAPTTSRDGSRLAPHRRVVHSRTTSAATSVSKRSRSQQLSLNAVVQDNSSEVFGDAVDEADERAAMVTSFKDHTKNTLASHFLFTQHFSSDTIRSESRLKMPMQMSLMLHSPSSVSPPLLSSAKQMRRRLFLTASRARASPTMSTRRRDPIWLC